MSELRRILIVEDSEPDVELTMAALDAHHLANEVVVARDGVEALEYLERRGAHASRPPGHPVVVLLDLKMPRLDGRAALRELRSRRETRHIPIVIVSSSDQQGDVKECYELGANSFVVKQLNPWAPGEYLVDTVRYWIDMNEVAR